MPLADADRPEICFDEEYRIRVLDTEKFNHTKELHLESNQFVTKIEEFSTIVQQVGNVLQDQASKIEREKLRAIGQRHKVEGERENRLRRKQALQTMINEKSLELERYVQQCEALSKIEEEQNALIERLSNNEA